MTSSTRLSRRGFLIGTGAAALALGPVPRAGATHHPSPTRPPVTGVTALLNLSAVEAVEQMSTGALSAERYATDLLARCAARESLNAWITLNPAQVLEDARAADRARAEGQVLGPLHGLPMPIKDSLNTRDYPTTGGTPALRGFRPQADAPIVATLRAAGAIVLGKTNLHELSFGWTSNNLAFGAVHNPYDATRIPGGSSGGTAAAVAARMAPLGVAEDTEGSIRVPAALCGLAGFRPTTGRYSTRGAVPISALFDQVGPHARVMADVALFDRVASGDGRAITPTPLAGVRLAVARGYFWDGLDPEVERVSRLALARLRDAGAILVEAEIPGLEALIQRITYQVQNHDVRVELAEYLREYGAPVGFDEVIAHASADIRQTFADAILPGAPQFVTEAQYRAAVDEHLPVLRRVLADYYARTGAAAIVYPATMVTAPRIGDEGDLMVAGHPVPFEVAIARNIAPASTAGLPGLVLPVGLAADGLPVSLEFDGPAGTDRALLGLGLSLAAVLGPLPAPRDEAPGA